MGPGSNGFIKRENSHPRDRFFDSLKNDAEMDKEYRNLSDDHQIEAEDLFVYLKKDLDQDDRGASYWTKISMPLIEEYDLDAEDALGLVKIAMHINNITGTRKMGSSNAFLEKNGHKAEIRHTVSNMTEAIRYFADRKNYGFENELEYITESIKGAFFGTDPFQQSAGLVHSHQVIGSDSPTAYFGKLVEGLLNNNGFGKNRFARLIEKID